MSKFIEEEPKFYITLIQCKIQKSNKYPLNREMKKNDHADTPETSDLQPQTLYNQGNAVF